MAKKGIRLTFFYADQGVWDYEKKQRIRNILLVKWANDFYSKYDFEIDEFPIGYNEKLYKKKFSLAKTNGLQVHNNEQSQIYAEITKKEKELKTFRIMRKMLGQASLLDDSKKMMFINFAELEIEVWEQLHKLKDELMNLYDFEYRKLIYQVNKNLGLNLQKKRLAIVFCEFKVMGISLGITTPELKDPGFLSIITRTVKWPDSYLDPIIFINIKQINKRSAFTLAHEIGHAAGTLVHSNTANSIMMGDQNNTNFGKAPIEVILEEGDKTKLEMAFFVI